MNATLKKMDDNAGTMNFFPMWYLIREIFAKMCIIIYRKLMTPAIITKAVNAPIRYVLKMDVATDRMNNNAINFLMFNLRPKLKSL